MSPSPWSVWLLTAAPARNHRSSRANFCARGYRVRFLSTAAGRHATPPPDRFGRGDLGVIGALRSSLLQDSDPFLCNTSDPGAQPMRTSKSSSDLVACAIEPGTIGRHIWLEASGGDRRLDVEDAALWRQATPRSSAVTPTVLIKGHDHVFLGGKHPCRVRRDGRGSKQASRFPLYKY
jgi:hypothetical protein